MASDILEGFHRCVPDDFLRDSIRCLRDSYDQARIHCQDNFPPSEAHDLFPYERRARFELSWRMRGSRFPGITGTAQSNDRRTSFFTEITSGSVVLTASAVASPLSLPRDAKYRKTRARSMQRAFEFVPQDLPDPDELLYGILIHGPGTPGSTRLTFAQVVFPDPECTEIVDHVDLFARFPEIATEVFDDHAERIEDEAAIRLLPRIRTAEDGT